MKISNKSYFILWRIFLLILVGIFFADLVLSQVQGSISSYFEDHIPAIVSGGLILILAGIRVNYFSYEDEYEIIHIQSKSLLFGSFKSPAQTRYEFPKRIIYDFKVEESWFHRVLVIHLLTQHGVEKIRKFNLTFVPLKKLKYVLQSLQRIRESNEQLIKA